jgi:hypothetical protein
MVARKVGTDLLSHGIVRVGGTGHSMSGLVCDMCRLVDHFADEPKSLDAQSQRVRRIHRVIPGVGVGLPGLGNVGIYGQELPRGRVVIAPY